MNHYIFLAFIVVLFSCNNGTLNRYESNDTVIYHNHYDNIKYVGKDVCKTCHVEIYDSYMHTGMGKSFSIANNIKSVIDEYNNPLIYDTISDLYYQPLWINDSLHILEFRLNNEDTVHKYLQKIDYIIGSGHHTNSHLYSINGYLHQVPYTFYTQSEIADLPPGYESGNNTRFSREIGMECISCHNAYPSYVKNSTNKYVSMPQGIDCERCHGPGEVHVQEKMSGNIIDTSKYIDYSIVNPSKLSSELQFEICKRCHLQGTTVLKNGVEWDDFLPGKKLSDYMETFVPRYQNDESFIMASHVDRLQQSDCHKIGGVNCTSCHNPHKSVTDLEDNYFNKKCNSCHNLCEENELNINCVSCHMPKSGSSDIPHVTITDHNISVHIEENNLEKGKFLGLYCVNNQDPTDLSKAKAYLKHFEAFNSNLLFLDSAIFFLERTDITISFPYYIQYHYLKKDYKEIIKLHESFNVNEYLNIFTDEVKSFVYFRIAEAYDYYNFLDKSYNNYLLALNISPENLDFLIKTAVIEIKMSNFEIAKNRLEYIIELNPNFEKAYYNLAMIYLNVENNIKKSNFYLERSIYLNPDYKIAKEMLNSDIY